MVQAIYNGVVLAEAEETVMVEGNHYFPPEAVNRDYFSDNPKHTTCPWKGEASYYDVTVNGETKSGLAWYYPNPKDAAKEIKNHVAFYPQVEIKS